MLNLDLYLELERIREEANQESKKDLGVKVLDTSDEVAAIED